MNDLDKRIAELKGLWWDEAEGCVWLSPPVPMNRLGIIDAGRTMVLIGHFSYSNDERAFELVDELCVDQENGAGARFHLIRWEAKQGRAAYWEARIEPYWLDGVYTLTQMGSRFDGVGATRPEAICRAYIAAREWMATKGDKE